MHKRADNKEQLQTEDTDNLLSEITAGNFSKFGKDMGSQVQEA